MQHTHKIAVIDSGAGGISILSEIIKKIQDLHCIYVADHQMFPYGEMSENELRSRLTSLVEYLVAHYRPSIIVIGCNTASTLALSHLRQIFDVDFVGVVPAIKPASTLSKSSHIGVLATPATVSRSYTHNLSKTFAHRSTVSYYGTTQLVKLAENYLTSGAISQSCVDTEVFELIKNDPQIDVIVLACTHFPLLKNSIQRSLDKFEVSRLGRKNSENTIKIVDSGEAIARRVESILSNTAQASISQGKKTKNSDTGVHIHYLSTSASHSTLDATKQPYDSYLKNTTPTLFTSDINHLDLDSDLDMAPKVSSKQDNQEQ